MTTTHDYFYEYEYHDYDKFYRRLSDPSEISSDSGGGGPPTPDRIPIYEALPPGAASLHYHPQDDSDSGNSTDRSPKDDHHQSGDETKILKFSSIPTTEVKPENNLKGCNQKGCSQNTGGTSTCGSNNEKVMIVSGDSQNLVVDLSGVPPDLRDAIISGTALVTLPDGLNQRLDPGYTVVTVPQGHEYEVLPSSKNHTYLGKSKESVDFATKNLTQVWEVMQHKGKGKRITTILPYHPNQDSHTTADFTIEGQPQARQTKRVKRQKTRRCLCRICGIFVFLGAFLGVIVTLSLFYTNGKHYFGPV